MSNGQRRQMMTSHGSRRRPIILKDESNKNNEKFSNLVESPRTQAMNVSKLVNNFFRTPSRFSILIAFVRVTKFRSVQHADHQPNWQETSRQLVSRACRLLKTDLIWSKIRRMKKLKWKISNLKFHPLGPRSQIRNGSWSLNTKKKWETQTKFISKEAWSVVQGCTNRQFRPSNVCLQTLSKLWRYQLARAVALSDLTRPKLRSENTNAIYRRPR